MMIKFNDDALDGRKRKVMLHTVRRHSEEDLFAEVGRTQKLSSEIACLLDSNLHIVEVLLVLASVLAKVHGGHLQNAVASLAIAAERRAAAVVLGGALGGGGLGLLALLSLGE